MAGEERTEKATPKHRKRARDKGQVARSPDLGGSIVLVAGLLTLSITGAHTAQAGAASFRAIFAEIAEPARATTAAGLSELAHNALATLATGFLPVAGACLLAGLLIGVAQVGFAPTTHSLKMDFRRINPVSGAKNLLGPNLIFETLKAVAKIGAVGLVAALALIPGLTALSSKVGISPAELGVVFGQQAMSVAQRAAFAYVLIGLLDYGWKRYQHEKKLKMTKQEVKDETRQYGVSAEVRAAQRRRRMQAARTRMMAAIPDADVVVANPTHYAVALMYDGSRTAPEVVAKGKDLIAAQIRRIAEENGVPVVTDPPLARALHASTEIGQIVPEELYAAVARVLAFVYRMAGRSPARQQAAGLVNTTSMRRFVPHADMLAAVAVVLVVTMLVVPLPAPLLDLLITLNIAVALTVVAATMYLGKALDFAAFPSLLLLTTMFRLAINVSVTRLILTTGDAGNVVKAFGEFVVGGNVIVGLVIFLILVVIQFVVVTNGAGRVAEVGARFTLDAMPGKQMAIDADLNAGLITEEQARERRAEIASEADFYGAMDGASKFVKGDAMAAVIITAINLIGGIVVGMVQRGLSFEEATHTYSLLTVGDGLAAQIPALLISVATGIIVTRAASDRDLGSDIANQVLSQRKAPLVAAGAIGMFALIPGLPKLPFLMIAAIFAAIGYAVRDGVPGVKAAAAAQAAAKKAALPKPGDEPIAEVGVDALELAIGFGLVPLVDGGSGGSLLRRVSMIRRQLASDLGLVIPPVRIHDELGMESHEYVLKVRGAEVTRGRIMPGHLLAMDPGDASGTLQGIPTREPAFGLEAVWVHESARAEAESLGYTVVDAESVIVTHLTETIRAHAAEVLTRQDVRALLDKLKESNAAVVEEVVPEALSVGEIQRVLQSLLSEGVPIRDLGTIVEAIGDKARTTRDTSLLSEYARQALGRAITAPHLDEQLRLQAITLDPAIEQEVATSITQTTDGEYLAMDPPRAQAIVGALRVQVEHATATGARGGRTPILLCSARIRRHLRRLVAQAQPHLAVCSYNEISPGINVETIGVIHA